MQKRRTHNSGFTIIELGVVMVVLGLLLAGILVGQELVKAAILRNVVNQLTSYDTAANAFYLKYGGLPGDLRTAEVFGLGTTDGPGENGDGNFSIGYETQLTLEELLEETDNIGAPENANFWYHLAQAGLIEGNYDGSFTPAGVPRTKIRNAFILSLNYVWDGSGYMYRNGYYIGQNRIDWDIGNLGGVESRAGAPKLLAAEAFTLDQKMDDGDANTGHVRNMWPFARSCTTNSGIYKVSEETPRCAITVSMRGAASNHN